MTRDLREIPFSFPSMRRLNSVKNSCNISIRAWGRKSPRAVFVGMHEHRGELSAAAKLVAATPFHTSETDSGRARAKMRKKTWPREHRYRDREYEGPSDAAQLALDFFRCPRQDQDQVRGCRRSWKIDFFNKFTPDQVVREQPWGERLSGTTAFLEATSTGCDLFHGLTWRGSGGLPSGI